MEIKTYSGFPSFYDQYIFTQSMDYTKNTYTLYCITAENGSVKWKKLINKPFKIFSPVVYKGKVYLANGKSMLCLDLKTGDLLWEKEYFDYITSNPSFTEREILFSVGNRRVIVINPSDGSEITSIDQGEGTSPYFVIIRDQIYIATTFQKTVGDRQHSYASLKAISMREKKVDWDYIPPFPGGAYQPVAQGGIMFLPAGNYLYAIGTDYYPRVIDGGSGYYDPYNRIDQEDKKLDEVDKNEPKDDKKLDEAEKNRLKDDKKLDELEKNKLKDDKKFDEADKDRLKKDEKPRNDSGDLSMRKMKITTRDKDGGHINTTVEITKWHKGKKIYSKKIKVNKKDQEVDVPDAENVEITATGENYIPKKVIISREDKDKTIILDPIEKGKGFVVENIHFEFDKAHLKKESLNILDRMIEIMKKNRTIKLEVRGYTDSIGTKEYNQKLSEKRADAVVDYMIKNGISPERLDSIGFGEKNPVASNNTKTGRKKNRRTEFYILEK
jgi:outer membrane protein OmpA-like peptidoglycan-associated protein